MQTLLQKTQFENFTFSHITLISRLNGTDSLTLHLEIFIKFYNKFRTPHIYPGVGNKTTEFQNCLTLHGNPAAHSGENIDRDIREKEYSTSKNKKKKQQS